MCFKDARGQQINHLIYIKFSDMILAMEYLVEKKRLKKRKIQYISAFKFEDFSVL